MGALDTVPGPHRYGDVAIAGPPLGAQFRNLYWLLFSEITKVSRSRSLFALLLVTSLNLVHAAEPDYGRDNLVTVGIPEISDEVRDGLRQYRAARGARFVGWLSGANGITISTRFGQTSQLHQVSKPGSARTQLTFFDEPVSWASTPPGRVDTPLVAYSRDARGAENYQLYVLDTSSGRSRRFTDGASRNGFAVWSFGADQIAFNSNKRNGIDSDIYVYSLETKAVRPIVTVGGAWYPQAWSTDGSLLAVERYVSVNHSELYVVDVSSGELTEISRADEPAAYDDAVFTADGSGLFFVSDRGTQFRTLRHYELLSGTVSHLTEDSDWGVTRTAVSSDGDYLAYVSNNDGYDVLQIRDLRNNDTLELPKLPTGVISALSFHPQRAELGFSISTATAPGDIFSLVLDSNRVIRWTQSETGGLNAAKFVPPSVVRYPTFDQVSGKFRTIPAFYYRPSGAGPFPVLIDIHGGPESQERPSFNAFIQYLVNEKRIAVLAPNVRGSQGFGKDYLKLDNGMRREDSVKDIGALIDWVALQSSLDANNIAVYGGSYGGYMVLAALVKYGERLRGGVDIVGISNFVTFLQNTKAYRRDLRRAEYGDERDPEMSAFLDSISPANHAEKINKPLFVIQGLNDPRVPVSEAEQILAAVRRNGASPWYLMARNEGHGFRKKANRDYMFGAVVMFLEKILNSDQDAEGIE